MSFARTFVLTVIKCRVAAIRQSPGVGRKQNLLVGFVACRFASTQQITKNIEVICQDETPPTLEKPFTADKPVDRPLLVLMEWLFAKKKHVMKYGNIYLDQGFDVLRVHAGPLDLIWPANGTRVIAKDLLQFLDSNTGYNQIMIHGFSIGGYICGELLDHAYVDRERYNRLFERIVCQIWDSAADVTELSIGTSKAAFPNNETLQKLCYKYMEFHMRVFYKQATQYYLRSSHHFNKDPLRAPALFLVSKKDPVGTVAANEKVRTSWASLGIQTHRKVFENSGHVGHFHKYPKEYVHEIYNFLDKLKMIRNEEKIRAYM
ncbi:transmembrane protein 53-A [Chelonus insularis]|uniref:transmembrane protein 53-A n=1 Tax=Chelonus insularis TaxID=460826 RepID=UPI00158F536F|nr:transmembrane protein 53-A [Chelonus insularis]XP_034952556.1 transmembrane protein 53-A [Chelonus insularis]